VGLGQLPTPGASAQDDPNRHRLTTESNQQQMYPRRGASKQDDWSLPLVPERAMAQQAPNWKAKMLGQKAQTP
jgi:hypothetical protein